MSSKKTSNEINVKLAEAAQTETVIDEIREKYRPVAFRGSLMYFCIADLANVDPMYQYSLQWLFSSRDGMGIGVSCPSVGRQAPSRNAAARRMDRFI